MTDRSRTSCCGPRLVATFHENSSLGLASARWRSSTTAGRNPHQLRNLAGEPEHAETRNRLWARLESALREGGDPRVEGRDPWQAYAYRQVDGFGATYNRTLSDEERLAARDRGKHAVGHAKPDE